MSWDRPRFGGEAGSVATLNDAFHAYVAAGPRQEERPDDAVIARVQLGRTILGIIAAVWLVLAYPLSNGREEFVLGKLVELGISCAILLVASIIGITAFLVAGTPDRRRDFAGRLLRPVLSILALAAGPLAIWLSLTTVKGDLVGGADLMDFFSPVVGRGIMCSLLSFAVLVLGWLLALVLLIVSIPFTVLTAYVCVASCFRASDVHQLLPALLSPLLVWSLFAFQVFTGPDVAAPPEVLYTFLLGGPLSVTALSVWEVRRLRSRHGITLRTALGR